MPVDTENFLRCIATLADNNNMRVGLSQTKKASAICGALTFLGGVVSGRVGLTIGMAIGLATVCKLTGSFRSFGDIIRNDLSMAQKERLQVQIVNAVCKINPVDLEILLPLLSVTPSLQQAALRTVAEFITNELHYTLDSLIIIDPSFTEIQSRIIHNI